MTVGGFSHGSPDWQKSVAAEETLTQLRKRLMGGHSQSLDVSEFSAVAGTRMCRQTNKTLAEKFARILPRETANKSPGLRSDMPQIELSERKGGGPPRTVSGASPTAAGVSEVESSD